jgi:CBS domain-containing protein
MEIELQEIRDFLAQSPPFDNLPAATLDQLPRKLVIRYLRRGSHLPQASSEGRHLYIVRSGALELRDNKDRLREKLAEGDLYAGACRPQETADTATAITCEDSLLYLLPCEELDALCNLSESFAGHFSESLRERLMRTAPALRDTGPEHLGALTNRVGDLLQREPVTLAAGSSIQAAAELMTAERVSSLLIVDQGRLVGLVTDSDLRRRCIARGLPVDRPVCEIMTGEPQTIDPDALVGEALLTMTRLRLHHLPVRHGQALGGMITVSDLVRHASNNPVHVATAVRKARSVAELVQLSTHLPELQLQLSRSSATAQHIGEAIASITDAVTGQLIELAIQQLGPAPVPFAWLAGGSQGRREQTAHTDQDNALLLDDSMNAADDDYFATLAGFVCDGLHACGFVHCPGDAMASNERWRQPLHVWQQYCTDWIERPEPRSLMLASIFFDLRPVYGDAALFEPLQQQVLASSRENRIFIAHMVANALTHRPPLGFFRHFVLIHGGEHDDTLDIKHSGLVPIVDVARVYALSEGLTPVNTRARLQAAAACGKLRDEMSSDLQDAFEFIASLRITHQATQIRTGKAADNYLPPGELSSLERSHLKDAFAVIKTIQETLENRYQAGRFI